nr:retrovirus-related Pol polyprotein from transposon TNT 1-94 [Tanacetum cinerariifolium]
MGTQSLLNVFVQIVQIVQICLWIIDSGCSKHMTGNHALLTNLVKSFLERFALPIMFCCDCWLWRRGIIFIKDHVEKGTIELYFVGTEYQLADLFTKSLPEARFKFLVEKLGIILAVVDGVIRRVSEPTGSSRHDESPYALLGQSDSEEESEKVVLGAEDGGQDKDQMGSNAGAQAEDQTGSDAGAQAKGQAGSNPNETSEGQAGSNPDETSEGQAGLDPGDAEAKQLDEGFTSTAYLKVQENLKLAVEEQVLLEEPASSSGTLSSLQHLSRDFSFGDQFFSDKPSDANKNAETEVESMEHQQLKATTTNTTTTTFPPPQAPQQSTTEAMMVKHIGELEHIMADLIQVNKGIEVRLDSHGSRLYTLEQLDIPQQVSITVSEVVTDAVDWAMQAPLCNRFRDLPEADMKEIFHQRMWETESYKSHEDHRQLFEALEKSMNHDHSDELTQDLAEARKKKKKSRKSPKMPPGSPSHQPPPPLPPAGPSGPLGAPGAFGSSQELPPPTPLPPPSSTSQENIGSAHISTVNLRQGWWKHFQQERPVTPEPAWSIRLSDVPVPTNNWASALASNYSPPPEDSLLAQTGDIATFRD